ncbi:histidine kinase [Actinotalea sp. C106]|uniref:histidine kinase n=1 Tax=Actinotalea sp. C106 TaxID=2908644 RepID=UPI0020288D85|nr:histidine kinase [Actinotalea sp. C106]
MSSDQNTPDPDQPVEGQAVPDQVPGEPAPAPSVPAPEPAPVPDAEELERVATPASVRRAPRYRGFVVAGALLGILVAVPTVLLWRGGTNELGLGPVVVFTGLTLAVLGAILGAVVAVVADRRSRR